MKGPKDLRKIMESETYVKIIKALELDQDQLRNRWNLDHEQTFDEFKAEYAGNFPNIYPEVEKKLRTYLDYDYIMSGRG